MENNEEINVEDLVSGLLEQIGILSKENALLKVQVGYLLRKEESEKNDVTV